MHADERDHTESEPGSTGLGAGSYVLVDDVAASWERYEELAAPLRDAVPPGLIVHAAGRTDEGFRIVQLWESEDAWKRSADLFHDDARHVVRALQPEHVVYGEREEV
jgi:hypothetical protein